MSLTDQIKRASSVKEVEELLAKGKKFEHPSEKTKRRWKENSELRISQLTNNQQ